MRILMDKYQKKKKKNDNDDDYYLDEEHEATRWLQDEQSATEKK